MRIGIFHGYELGGSGSNEYTRYLAGALTAAGHDVHVLCREPEPETIAGARRAFAWTRRGTRDQVIESPRADAEPAAVDGFTMHVLPHADVRPVFLTDKQREGPVKSFGELTDAELDDYHTVTTRAVRAVLDAFPVDVLHVNHVVWQPCVAAELDVPFVVYPHGSAIEYTVRADPRYRRAAGRALGRATGVISGSREVLGRLVELWPATMERLAPRSLIVGVGVDTDLFAPVATADRDATIARLGAALDAHPRGGKSAELRQRLRERLSVGDWAALTDGRDGYDQSCPDADAAERLARLPWSATDDGDVLLFVGALTAGKGLQAVITALPSVLARRPNTHLVVVGGGAYREVLEGLVHAIATGDQELFDHLRSHGFDLDRSDLTGGWADVHGDVPHAPNLADRVHFVGRLDHALLRWLFPCADLAVFPSIVPEAYPLVLMEALSNGVLPLVSDFSGFRDGLDTLADALDERTIESMRLPIDPSTRVDGIASRLLERLDDGSSDECAARLRSLAVERFDWRVRARQMTDAWETLLRTVDAFAPNP